MYFKQKSKRVSKKVKQMAVAVGIVASVSSLEWFYITGHNERRVQIVPVATVETLPEVTISNYDELFKKYSSEINWDWRLLASLVCQESRFKPQVRSQVGAYGLMQLMPATMRYFGVDTTATAEQHIKAGVEYIKYLDKMLSKYVTDDEERVKFVLASYNIGPGHVLDAYRLASLMGKDATVWDNNVALCLLSKGNPQWYNQSVVRHGPCVGKETFAFVSEIIKRYDGYRNGLVI